MAKTISLKSLFVIALAVLAIFAAQVMFVQAQEPAKAAALSSAQEAQLRAVAEGSFPITLQFTAAVLKTVMALKAGETAQVSVPEQKTKTAVPVIAERNKDGFCIYFQDGITIDAKKPMKVAGAFGGLGLAQIKNLFSNKPVVQPVDPQYPGSACFTNVKKTFAFTASIVFDKKVVDSVLTQSGAELLASAKLAACPKNIQALVGNIEKRCAKNPDAANCRIAGQNALKTQLAKNPKTVDCDPSGFLMPVSPTTSVAPGRPQPGTPGGGEAVPPTPPSRGAQAPTTYDFGDATLGFPTLLSENGPRHRLSNRVWLGERIDGEADGLRTNRDDEVGVGDEDGMLASNPQFTLLVRTGPAVSGTVYINAWEDWNKNNRWDINTNGAPGDEWIVRNQPLTDMRPNMNRDVALAQPRNGPDGQPLPAAWSDPAAWVRFMVTESRIPNGNPAFASAFNSGETEDYIGVQAPAPEHPGEPSAPPPTGAPAGGAKGAVGPAS